MAGAPDRLRSHWWVITINADTAAPTCYVLTLGEVRTAAHLGVNAAGIVSFWLQPKACALPEYQKVSLARSEFARDLRSPAITDWAAAERLIEERHASASAPIGELPDEAASAIRDRAVDD